MAQKLGKYQVLKRLALGGISEIFLAVEDQGRSVFSPLNRKVIIKKLLPQYSEDPRMRKLIHYEARLLAALNHANIVQVYDAGIDSRGESYMVQEFIDGTDLKAFFNIARETGATISPPIIYYIAEQVLRALVHVHELSDNRGNSYHLIHRDLSPTNIMVSMSGDVKLLDFGLAKRSVDITTSGNIAGKIPYMAPEQFERVRIDSRIDLFALGSVLYELITGLHRFNGESDLEIIRRIRGRHEQPLHTIARGFPPEMISCFGRAMEYDREERFHSAREMLNSLVTVPARHTSLHRGRELLQDFMEYNFGATKIDTSFVDAPEEIDLVTEFNEGIQMPLTAGEFSAMEQELRESETIIYREEDHKAQPNPPGLPPDRLTPTATALPVPDKKLSKPKSSSPSNRWPFMLLMATVIFGAMGITFLYFQDKKNEASDKVLILNGNYGNNQVFFDDTPHGKLPCAITIPADGKPHDLRVEAPGFFPWVRKLRSTDPLDKEMKVLMRRYQLDLEIVSDYTDLEIAILTPGIRRRSLKYLYLPVIIKELRPNSLIKISVRWRHKRKDVIIKLPERAYHTHKIDPMQIFRNR
ncbi:protein kinase [Myxococcota bacterium]|nr:protein kinase [Myxococcota bacterium]